MSSETLMEKPMSGKFRCRTQSWYIVLASFLLWFTLYMCYLYSSSVTFRKRGHSFVANNHTGFLDSSQSFHVVDRDDETQDPSHVEDIDIVDNVVDDDETETDEDKTTEFSYIEEVNQVIDSMLSEDQNDTDTDSAKDNEDVTRNEEVNNMAEDDKPVVRSSAQDKRKEGRSTKQRKGTNVSERQRDKKSEEDQERRKEDRVVKQKEPANVLERQRGENVEDQAAKRKGAANLLERQRGENVEDQTAKRQGNADVSERQREDNPEDQPVEKMLPAVKSQTERPQRPRRRERNKPADSLDPVMEKRIKKVVAEPRRQNPVQVGSDSCSGRYIYIHNLPRKFNQDLLENCRSLSFWTDMCECASNLGLGARLSNDEKLYSNSGWFATNQFLLEVIFHNRMKQYKCLTKDPLVASAIYVPYYAGLDVGRYLWDPDGFMRDYDALNLVKWLASRPEWKRMWGRDHFLVAGRINWDFRRDPKNESDWGNELLNFDESRNMTMLVLESSPWNYNDFAIPYPTYFHPSRDDAVFQWQNKMRRLKRRFLFSFAGARRPGRHESIRNELIEQCLASRRRCRFLECDKTQKCHKPANVMRLFQNSIFCLQPPGDSYTRRSIFDSIIAGCIPVFFHPGSAYVQYIWHFPRDYNKYSVMIPESDVKTGKANIERILTRVSRDRRVAMKDEIIKMIPKVIYADPSSRLGEIEDAFDLTIKGILDRVETVRNQMNEGRLVNYDFEEEESWKYFAIGKLGPHEWDTYFSRKNGKHGP
ncbi:xyloglucan galactosyltransferase KATAMARI1 homolog [Gossypium arboreum]|uniref:xyloglucan galactosyltransferase KATAMARI1 homolog n=1 Tax=Gossypium arboreum TaxID=29729 RepID=UPI0022F18E01|nr:xyloglucan galactosyltransferase KATAMARI1 homolog [Gossypium arboreum]